MSLIEVDVEKIVKVHSIKASKKYKRAPYESTAMSSSGARIVDCCDGPY